jgi:hypothetical protein
LKRHGWRHKKDNYGVKLLTGTLKDLGEELRNFKNTEVKMLK